MPSLFFYHDSWIWGKCVKQTSLCARLSQKFECLREGRADLRSKYARIPIPPPRERSLGAYPIDVAAICNRAISSKSQFASLILTKHLLRF